MMSQPNRYVTHIKKTAGVCGGDACVNDSRIMVWLIVFYRLANLTAEQIVAQYPESITVQDVAACMVYYQDHKDEIDRSIWENQEENCELN